MKKKEENSVVEEIKNEEEQQITENLEAKEEVKEEAPEVAPTEQKEEKRESKPLGIGEDFVADESAAEEIESKRTAFLAQYKKARILSRAMMGVVVLAVIGAIVLITINGIGFKIAGYALAGATLLGMLIFYIVTKNKMPSTSKVYISEVSKMINKFVFADNRFSDTTLYEDRKLSSVELGLDKVYKEAVDCGSRNFIKAKYNGKEFEVSEVALYIMEGSGRKSVKKVAFLGKYISMVNDLKFDGRFIFNIKRKEKPFDQPTDIDDLKLITDEETFQVYSNSEKQVKDVFGTEFIKKLKAINPVDPLLNAVVVAWPGHYGVYLSYDDSVTVLPFQFPFKKEAQISYRKDLISVLELLGKK